MKTFLISRTGWKFDITNMSAGKVAEANEIKGHLGKTSILEMLRDHSISRKGWTIREGEEKPAQVEQVHIEHVPAANKLGIKPPTKGLRNRKPAIIKYYPTDKLESSYHSGDFGKYLAAIKNKPGIEASELANQLGWSRDQITQMAGKFRQLGLIHQQKESQALNAKRKEPGNLFLQSLTAGGYGTKTNVWMGKNTNFNFA